MFFRMSCTRWGPLTALTTISGFIPAYTHLKPWLNRVCWVYSDLITRGPLLVCLDSGGMFRNFHEAIEGVFGNFTETQWCSKTVRCNNINQINLGIQQDLLPECILVYLLFADSGKRVFGIG